VLDVAMGHGFDEVTLFGRGVARREREGLLSCGVCEGRFGGGHQTVEIGAPSPGLAPEADGAVRVALFSFAEGARRVLLSECIHELKALVEVGLGFGVR
jgi:hypothetical protein